MTNETFDQYVPPEVLDDVIRMSVQKSRELEREMDRLGHENAAMRDLLEQLRIANTNAALYVVRCDAQKFLVEHPKQKKAGEEYVH